MNSTVPAPTYPTSSAMAAACLSTSFSSFAGSMVEPDSSNTFCFSRCTLQSRRPSTRVLPRVSRSICTSM